MRPGRGGGSGGEQGGVGAEQPEASLRHRGHLRRLYAVHAAGVCEMTVSRCFNLSNICSIVNPAPLAMFHPPTWAALIPDCGFEGLEAAASHRDETPGRGKIIHTCNTYPTHCFRKRTPGRVGGSRIRHELETPMIRRDRYRYARPRRPSLYTNFRRNARSRRAAAASAILPNSPNARPGH